jgi:molybdopterin synthase sulfur carrier subunit
MAHVAFTTHLKRFFPDLEPGEVAGATVREVFDALEQRHRGLLSYLTDDAGRLRRHVNVFVGDEPIRDRAHLTDALAPDDKVFILQALSGG